MSGTTVILDTEPGSHKVCLSEHQGTSRRMRKLPITIALITGIAVAYPALATGQDSPPLGDVARQARQQKQSKTAAAKNGQSSAPKVITDDEIGNRSSGPDTSADTSDQHRATSPASDTAKTSAEQWKSQIQAQKEAINAQQSRIDKVSDSIQFAPGNCVSGCVQWNENQQEKQKQVEQMRTQLETQKKRLQEMQDAARQQGYGSSVYDP
jgi:hypothetical protein